MKDPADFVFEQLAESFMSNATPASKNETKILTTEISNIVADLIQEIPEKIKDKDFPEDSLHSQFKVMTQQLLLGAGAKNNVAGLVKAAANNLGVNIGSYMAEVASIGKEAVDFADDLKELTADPSVLNVGKNLLSAAPRLKTSLEDIRHKTVQLQSRISSKQDFSTQRVESLLSGLNSFKSMIPTVPAISSLFASTSLINNASLLTGGLSAIMEQATGVAGFKDNLLKTILPGDIFASNFTKLYSTYNDISSGINSLSSNLNSGEGGRALSAIGSSIGKINSVIGQLKTLNNKQFVEDLKDIADPIVNNIQSLSDNITGHVFPVNEVKKITNDVKALSKVADRLIAGRMPNAGVIDALKNRITTNIGSVANNLTTFKNILNVFEPTPTSDVAAFISSVGTIAPAAMDAIVQGDIARFEKTLLDPNLLTLAGHAIADIQEAKASIPDLSVPDANKMGVLVSVLAGNVKRQMQAAAMANIPEQRKKALKSFDYYVTTFLEPTRMLVNELTSKFGG